MTCIVGIAEDGVVYLGGDSAISTEDGAIFVARKPKVFRRGPLVIGVTGGIRVDQLIQCKFNPPPVTFPVERYMVVDFIDALKAVLKEDGRKDEDLMDDSVLLVGVCGHLFLVTSNFQASEMACGYDAHGSAGEIARGSLHATEMLGLPPRQRLEMALNAAQEHNAFVRAPFTFVQTQQKEKSE